MYPVHDVDALLLIAITLSSKRRPAQLVEIVAALDLLQVTPPSATRLLEAFDQLGRHGMINLRADGFCLTEKAESVMARQPRRGSSEERIFRVRDDLSALSTKAEYPPVVVTEAAIEAALLAHKEAATGREKNLLVPKPRVSEGEQQKPGQRFRKPLPARKRQR